MITEKIKQIKISRLDKNERYFYDLTNNLEKERDPRVNNVFLYRYNGKVIFKLNIKDKIVGISWDIRDYYIINGMIDEIDIKDFLSNMLKNYLGVENYEILYFA